MISKLWTSLAGRVYRNEMIDGGEGASAAPETAAPFNAQSAMESLLDDDGGIRHEESAANPTEERKEPAEEPKDHTPEDKPVDDKPAEDKPRYKVKIDGEEKEVELDELLAGYQRQSDYTRKTQQLSEQRQATENERQQAESERATYAQNIATLTWQLQNAVAQDQKIDWIKLAQDDPAEYVAQRAAADQRMGALQQAHAEQQKILAQQQAEQQTHLQSYIQQQQEALLAKLPDWKDADKAKTEKAQLREYLKAEGGFSDAELNGLTDHRTLLIARDAMLYRQMMQQADVAKQKVEKLPPKIERPGVADEPGRQANRDNMRLLRKTGKSEYAQKALENLL